MTQVRSIALGGGIAGLSAAYRAKSLGHRLPVYEASATPGGLLDSFQLENETGIWTFDNGVHLSFATEKEVREVFDRVPYLSHEARSLNWDSIRWLPHPVQNNMFALPVNEKVDLIADLAAHLASAPDEHSVRTYKDWLVHQYGNKIAERWPLTYTRKYWTVDAKDLGIAWIGSRMRRSDLREVLLGAMMENPPSTYYISTMRYPEHGGYRGFIAPLLTEIELHSNHRAIAIDNVRKSITFDNGVTTCYDRLISSIPLPLLIELMSEVPDAVRAAASTLFASKIDLISVGVRRPSVSPSLWFYIYDPDILAARVYSPSWKAPGNAPEGHSSLQFEIYSSVRNPQKASVPVMTENCIAALETMGLAKRDEVILVHHKHLAYGNVVFDIGMEDRRDLVRDWVLTQDVLLAGRFGEWEYFWSNQSFMSGRKAAEAAFGSAQ